MSSSIAPGQDRRRRSPLDVGDSPLLSFARELRALRDKAGSPTYGVLPLLSHALLEMWQRRRGNALTLRGFDAAGGFGGAVTRCWPRLWEWLTADRDALRAHRLLVESAAEWDYFAGCPAWRRVVASLL